MPLTDRGGRWVLPAQPSDSDTGTSAAYLRSSLRLHRKVTVAELLWQKRVASHEKPCDNLLVAWLRSFSGFGWTAGALADVGIATPIDAMVAH